MNERLASISSAAVSMILTQLWTEHQIWSAETASILVTGWALVPTFRILAPCLSHEPLA